MQGGNLEEVYGGSSGCGAALGAPSYGWSVVREATGGEVRNGDGASEDVVMSDGSS